LLLSAIFLGSLALVTAGQAPAAAPFTAAQVAAGRTAYDTTCASCHGADLAGPPPLAGTAFRGGWGSGTTRDLLTAVQSMPPEQPGGCPRPHARSSPTSCSRTARRRAGAPTATTVPIGSP
jgi:mono/diheme cytochrome c family protein